MWIALRHGLRRVWIPVILRAWPLARLWYRAWGLTLAGLPDDEVWYFAYGANMHDGAFRERRRMRPLEWRAGRIAEYRLRFNLEGRPRGKAAPANICPDKGAEVWGVLYRITRRDLVRLNATEGIPGWRYRPVWLEARDLTGKPTRRRQLYRRRQRRGRKSLPALSQPAPGRSKGARTSAALDRLSGQRRARRMMMASVLGFGDEL